MAFDTNTSEPNPVDIYVGARVRLRRKFLGMSQADLAAALGLTFQQVQKYERGTNRISASKMFEAARALKAPVAYFFEGYSEIVPPEGFEASPPGSDASHFLLSDEGLELAVSFPRVKSAQLRRRILDLVQALADGE